METTDKGLKKAIAHQPHYRLSSNFSYRTMQKIHQQCLQKEKQQEKRLFIAMLITTICMGTGCLGYIIWKYSTQCAAHFHLLQSILPDTETFLFYLPTCGAFILLYLFNKWLKRKMHSYL